jgi:hypothetical protein
VTDEEKKRQIAELMNGPQPEKKRPGKKSFIPAPDFDGAMAVLKPEEAQFVRHVLAGDTAKEAFAKVRPGRALQTQKNSGRIFVNRPAVKHAIALGKKKGALAAITGLRYDVQSAHQELCDRIEAAHKEGQHSAVAQLMKLKMTLHKLDQPQAQQQQGIQIILQTADGAVVRSFGAAQPATDIEGEEVPQ